MQHVLRHRSASGGRLENLWDLDDDGRVLASIRVASGPLVHVAIAVKSVRRRNRRNQEFGCWPIGSTREQWAIEHGVYDAHLEPPHPLLPPMSLTLSNCPADVASSLARVVAD